MIAAVSAAAGVIAASTCCLPTGALLASAGLSGASAFFTRAQPYLLGLAALCLAWGVVSAARAKQCSRRRRAVNFGVLVVCAMLVVPALVFPQQTAAFLADAVIPRGGPPSGQPPLARLDLTGLRQAFNDDSGKRRVIAMFSPT